MDNVNTLRRYGLFDAKVPRYTSYPPANRFEPGVGTRSQRDWLKQVPVHRPVSLYVHIPFCRRLCWFCACRTQATQRYSPVKAYVDVLLQEIDTVARYKLPDGVKMRRLHLGGGTPTMLSADLMDRLLKHISDRFPQTEGFEFSVEIDPTDAGNEVLDVLAERHLGRASIGVQDFDTRVQDAIGRTQSFETTETVTTSLRDRGVQSLHVDLLYGLPFQTAESLMQTIDRVTALRPDRLALYGYAHVPHVSKRQVMIPDEQLPDGEKRFVMSQIARDRLVSFGYDPLGIDHFAFPHDSLAESAHSGKMSRNFQGYTDDECETLIGFGASAISKFEQGFVQNAVSTSAYMKRISLEGLAGQKGFALTEDDRFIAELLEGIMCYGTLKFSELALKFPDRRKQLSTIVDDLMFAFPELLECDANRLSIQTDLMASARLVAARLEGLGLGTQAHSLAV